MEFLRSIALDSEFDVYSPGRYNIRHPVRGGMFIARATHNTEHSFRSAISGPMVTAAKLILRSIFGAGCGGVSGAALLAIPTYLSTQTGFLGPESAWWTLAAIVGCIWGFVPGALIGFLVAKFQTTGLISLIIGAAVGTGVLIGLFITGFDPFIDSEILYTGLAAIPIGAVIGLIVSTTNQPNLRS